MLRFSATPVGELGYQLGFTDPAYFSRFFARRAGISRREWLCGAALLGIVIVKLMLVDSAGGGGLARAIAFIGVAVLVLIIGYFSPLPPKGAKVFREEEKP